MKRNLQITFLVRYKGDAGKASKVYEGFIPLTGRDIADANFQIVPPYPSEYLYK